MLQYTESGISNLTVESVEYLFSYIEPNNSLIIAPGLVIDPNVIPNYINNIIFDDCTNPIDVTNHLTQINLKKFKILSGLFSHHNSEPCATVQFFPFWAVWTSFQQYSFSNREKKYKLSCLNGTPWIHRQLAYLELSNKFYFKDIVFTFKNNLNYLPSPYECKLTKDEYNRIAELPCNISFLNSDIDIGIDLSIDHPAYQETFVNLVTETTVSNITPMLSEKTFKPIAAGQLFILVASPGSIEFLRNIGIDTFDDIIDHSYDQEEDFRLRILKVVNELDRLMRLDLDKIYVDIKNRLYQNSIYFNSKEFRKQFQFNF